MVIKRYKFLLIVLALLVLINWASNTVYYRFDLTKEKRYTLTDRTKTLLKDLKKDMTITLFLDGEMPSAFKRLKNASKDLINDYKSIANVKVNIVNIDPLSGTSAQDQEKIIADLDEIGVKPVAVNIKSDAGIAQKIIFPVALFEIDGKPMPVNLLQKSGGPAISYEENITHSIQNLEYVFTSAIQSLVNGKSPRIGFTEGHDEPSNMDLYDAITSLSQRFYVGRVDLKLINKQGLDSLEMLVVANPQSALSEAEKYKINYFVMKGGKVVWLIDQVKASLEAMQNGEPYLTKNSELNLDDILFEYGARVNYNLIADLNSALIPFSSGPVGQSQIQLAPWLYFPVLVPDTSHNLVKNLDGVRTEFASTVDTIAVPNVKKYPVLSTSAYHKTYDSPKILSLQMLGEEPQAKDYNRAPNMAAVLLEGRFKSVFLNRSLPPGIDIDYQVPKESVPTKMLVVGDGSIFNNQVSKTDNMPFPLGYDRYSQQNYGNKNFLLNIADYFTEKNPLIDLRNKEIKARLLDKVKVKSEKAKWQWINMLFPLILLISFAIFQHYYRKYQYAK